VTFDPKKVSSKRGGSLLAHARSNAGEPARTDFGNQYRTAISSIQPSRNGGGESKAALERAEVSQADCDGDYTSRNILEG